VPLTLSDCACLALLTCRGLLLTDVTVELEDIVDAVNVSRTVVNPWLTILRRRYWPQLVISCLIPTFQQWVGINAIIFYAPRKS